MQARLTEKAVERYAPKPTRYEVHDTYLTGLSLRVTEKGRKSWYVIYRLAGAGPGGTKGKLIRLKIGDYPLFDLSKARGAAREVLEPAERGRDARLERAAQRETEQTRTFQAIFCRFLEIHVKENTKHGRFAREQERLARKAAELESPRRQWRRKVGKCDAERYIETFALPDWGNRLIETITRADVYDLLDNARMTDGVPKARELRKHLATMFNWAMNRGLLPYSPMAGLKATELKYTARRRVLTMDELRSVWEATNKVGYPYGDLVRLLILTGQRRSEIAELRSSWIIDSQRAVLVPADRYKTGRDHLYPLSAQAWTLVEKLPKWNAGDCRFSTTSGLRPFSGFSKAKAALDKVIAEQGANKDLPPMEGWTLHDIRRSVASHLPRLGVSSEHVSAVLGHVIAKGSDAHYNHYDYYAEKRAALELWGTAMDLSDELRKQLDDIRYGYDSFLHGPVDGERRPAPDADYRRKQRRLRAFAKAWLELDLDSQWDVSCALREWWEKEEESQPHNALGSVLPLGIDSVIASLLEEMKKPNGSPEDYPGFGDATLLLWTAYCQNRPPWVKIDDEACAEIGTVVAGIFELEQDFAETRVKSWLNEYEKDNELPGRERPPKSRPFP